MKAFALGVLYQFAVRLAPVTKTACYLALLSFLIALINSIYVQQLAPPIALILAWAAWAGTIPALLQLGIIRGQPDSSVGIAIRKWIAQRSTTSQQG